MTQEQVRALFTYVSGRLYWKIRPGRRVKVGDLAGCSTKAGYHIIRFNRTNYKAHRLIYLYHYGYLPQQIDHINGDKTDNRIENLRECNTSENARNRKYGIGKSDYKGVSWNSRRNKWKSCITSSNQRIFLGYFNTETEAAKAYNQKAIELFKEFAYLNEVR